MDLQALSDRAEIEDLLVRYTRAIDAGQWDRLEEVFTPDAHIDYTATGGIAAAYPEVRAWLAEVLAIFPRRLHSLHQVDRDVRGDEATVAAYFHNPMTLREADGTERVVEVGGIYHHELVRTGAGWRSRHLVEELVWQRGF